MMTKAEVAAFLSSLTGSSKSDADAPCVIMVRAAPETKTFIAEALEYLDDVSTALGTKDTPVHVALRLNDAEHRFRELGQRARYLNLRNIALGARHAELMTALLTSRMQRSLGDPASLRQLIPLLSAMLLRLYVDGNDQRCTTELHKIQELMHRSAQTVPFPGKPAAASACGVN